MDSCNSIIKQGLPKMGCDSRPVKGYERRAVLINREDVDYLLSAEGKQAIADLHVAAIMKYLGQ